MKPSNLSKDSLLVAVHEADQLLNGHLTTPAIKYWARIKTGPLWKWDLRTRAIMGALHTLNRWRLHAAGVVTFERYLLHHIHAAVTSHVIDPDAYAELRRILPLPNEPLCMFGLAPQWLHPWSPVGQRLSGSLAAAPASSATESGKVLNGSI
jgi:hypothetical protein